MPDREKLDTRQYGESYSMLELEGAGSNNLNMPKDHRSVWEAMLVEIEPDLR